MSDRLYIFDTTLRDGEQVPGCQLNTVEKIEVARTLEELGVDVIEAGFPVSSPGDFNSVVEISKAVTWPTICALTRAVENDIKVAAEALQYAKHKRIHTGIGTSDYHIRYKFNSTPRGDTRARGGLRHFRKKVCGGRAVLCRGRRARRQRVPRPRVVQAVSQRPARRWSTFPTQRATACLTEFAREDPLPHGACRRTYDKVTIATHCHNDLGMATANTVSGSA